MEASKTDIFISYRRIDGRDLARNVYLALKNIGYNNVFFDFNSLREGVFNEQIIEAINTCQDFILILSPQSMDRCLVEGDWVTREILTAMNANCNILPLQIDIPFPLEKIPKDLKNLEYYQFTTLLTNEYFEDSIRKLAERLKTKPTIKEIVSHEFELKITVDETSMLFINNEKYGKIKGGKFISLLQLKHECKYDLKFVNLSRKEESHCMSYEVAKNKINDVISINFKDIRIKQEEEIKRRKVEKERAESDSRFRWKNIQLICEGYDCHEAMYDNMILVKKGNNYGYLNENGFEVISCQYEDATSFYDGFACVKKNSKWGIINNQNEVIIPLISDEATCTFKGNVVLKQQGKYGIMKLESPQKIDFIYDKVVYTEQKDFFIVGLEGKFQLISINNPDMPILRFDNYKSCYYSMGTSYHYDLYMNGTSHYLSFPIEIQQKGLWGLMDCVGRMVIPSVFQAIYSFEGNYLVLCNYKAGIIDGEKYTYIVSPQYDCMRYWPGSNTMLLAVGYGCTLIDKNIDSYSFGSLAFKGGKHGFIDSNGKEVIPIMYDHVMAYDNYISCIFYQSDDHDYYIEDEYDVYGKFIRKSSCIITDKAEIKKTLIL